MYNTNFLGLVLWDCRKKKKLMAVQVKNILILLLLFFFRMKHKISLSTSILFVLHVIHQIDYAKPCSQTEILLNNDGQLYVIFTPFFPDNYPANVDCVYHMVAPTGMWLSYIFPPGDGNAYTVPGSGFQNNKYGSIFLVGYEIAGREILSVLNIGENVNQFNSIQFIYFHVIKTYI